MAVTTDYVELGVASAFSFLHASSPPEALIRRAAELGMSTIGVTDRDGLYGAPRFHMAAKKIGLRALCGSDLPLPDGSRLRVLAESQRGYRNLSRLLTDAKEGRKKGECVITWEMLEHRAPGLIALSPGIELDRLSAIFPDRLYVSVARHFDRKEARIMTARLDEARARKLPILATNEVRYARAQDADLQDVLACIREKTTLDSAGTLLFANRERHLKSPMEMAQLFGDLPDAIKNTRAVAERCEFTLENLGYQFPTYPTPLGEDEFSYLKILVEKGGRERYAETHGKAWTQLSRELALIEKLKLSGYFLIVWDLIQFCRQSGIMVQGRGSAANSAVCYVLGITAVDSVKEELLFERFLSEERGEWPDIDLDLPSGDQRERVIQYMYQRYGARGCAMTANCITYRNRSAVREVAKALGFPLDQIDLIAKRLGHFWSSNEEDDDALSRRTKDVGLSLTDPRVEKFVRLASEVQGLPRHLGQHSGGMVICAGMLDEIVPLEPASMPGRVVVQWDKEDCADMKIIKIDLLGLGMMAVLEESVPLIREHEGVEVDLSRLPLDDPKVYEMLCAADTVGVFQVESRAQMATLPRMMPKIFYDIVVEVALIRPGPIVGKMVHPYLERRKDPSKIQYDHPSLEPILQRTLGVPLFQEQLMSLSMAAAGFTGGQAEDLRRAMGSKRSVERMTELEAALRQGMTARGISETAQDQIVLSIKSFALYGFPESHAISFALLAYASVYLKVHHPAAFYTALLNQWPMGFYHPATLITDAKRHGINVRHVDVTESDWKCTIENKREIRVGLKYVAGLSQKTGEAIARLRPFASVEELVHKTGASRAEISTLASIGALNEYGFDRRSALWRTAEIGTHGELFSAARAPAESSPLSPMTLEERLAADFAGTGVTCGPHPMQLVRHELRAQGIERAGDLSALPDGVRVKVAGSVIVRQLPETAKGFFFITLEDETGFANAIITPKLFSAERPLLISAPSLIIEGVLQNLDGVVSVKADRFHLLGVKAAASHDFH